MASFYDDASLVVIPSGYKTSKIYAEKPTDGSGDLTFTRASDATRVASNGLIEKVRTNLLTYSNDFSNAAWNKVTDGTYSIATESIVDAFGNTSAVYKVTLLTGTFLVLRNTLGSATTQITNFSLYVKKTNASTFVSIDVDNNTDVAAANNTNWQRISNTRATASFVDVTTFSVNEPFYLFASQVELGDIATAYIPTTTAAVSVGPVSNVPRLDYLGSSCPRLLLEPQRTNLALYSEQFGNAIYVNQNTTVTANATTSPDGTANADKLVITGTGVTSIFQEILTTASNTYTISAFVKKAETQYANLGFVYSAGIYAGMQVDLNDGSIKRTFAVGYTNPTSSITSYGNGWYRLTFSCVITTNEAYPAILPSNALWTSGELRQNLTGNNTTGAFFYGLQAELGSYATSYIPTLSASVTRVADAASKTGISSLIGQTEGTLFAELSFPNLTTGASSYFYFTDGSFSNSVIIGREPASPNPKYFFYINAGGSVILNNTANNVQSGFAKLALAYKSGSWAAYLNGTQVAAGTDSFSFGSTMNRVGIGTNDGAITTTGESMIAKEALLFKTRLTNAQLAELTTL